MRLEGRQVRVFDWIEDERDWASTCWEGQILFVQMATGALLVQPSCSDTDGAPEPIRVVVITGSSASRVVVKQTDASPKRSGLLGGLIVVGGNSRDRGRVGRVVNIEHQGRGVYQFLCEGVGVTTEWYSTRTRTGSYTEEGVRRLYEDMHSYFTTRHFDAAPWDNQLPLWTPEELT